MQLTNELRAQIAEAFLNIIQSDNLEESWECNLVKKLGHDNGLVEQFLCQNLADRMSHPDAYYHVNHFIIHLMLAAYLQGRKQVKSAQEVDWLTELFNKEQGNAR